MGEEASTRRTRPRWIRPALLFVAMAMVLGLAAGKHLLGRSPAPHYAYVAEGWLQGRLHLEGQPPGYPRAHDDWAEIVTLKLEDGSLLRAHPCVTTACDETRRDRQDELGAPVEAWWIVGEDTPRLVARREIASRSPTWYVSFPPGPAVFMLPLVALFGRAAPEGLLVVLAAALMPAILLGWLDRRRPPDQPWDRVGVGNLFAAVALGLAGPAAVLGAHGRVWFTAQVLGALFCTIYVVTSDRSQQPRWAVLAGVALGFAVSCRPHLLLATPLFLIAWWRGGRSPAALAAFAVPLAIIGLGLALHNFARFGSIFEFGHRFLDIRWQTRMQESGQFSLAYLPRNLRCLLFLMPQLQPSWPFARVSIHGMAAWLASPWLLALPWLGVRAGRGFSREDAPHETGPRWPLWLCAALVAMVPLAYHNSGQLQFSYRFALDWLPFVVAGLALGTAFDRRWVQGLVLIGVAINLHGAWWFDRSPQALFVTDPLGWPFEDELR